MFAMLGQCGYPIKSISIYEQYAKCHKMNLVYSKSQDKYLYRYTTRLLVWLSPIFEHKMTKNEEAKLYLTKWIN